MHCERQFSPADFVAHLFKCLTQVNDSTVFDSQTFLPFQIQVQAISTVPVMDGQQETIVKLSYSSSLANTKVNKTLSQVKSLHNQLNLKYPALMQELSDMYSGLFDSLNQI